MAPIPHPAQTEPSFAQATPLHAMPAPMYNEVEMTQFATAQAIDSYPSQHAKMQQHHPQAALVQEPPHMAGAPMDHMMTPQQQQQDMALPIQRIQQPLGTPAPVADVAMFAPQQAPQFTPVTMMQAPQAPQVPAATAPTAGMAMRQPQQFQPQEFTMMQANQGP